jgi:hypothetical protein
LKDYKRMLFLFPNLSLFANMLKLKKLRAVESATTQNFIPAEGD